MNTFYYLDSLADYSIALYQIETDLSLDQLKKNINNKSIEYAKELGLNIDKFLNEDHDMNFIIKIGNKENYFSLSTGLSMYHLNRCLTKELKMTKIKFNVEEII